MSNKPNWELLRDCGVELTKNGITPFTRKQLIECVQGRDPSRGDSSLNPMIQGMTVNLKGGAPGGIGKDVFRSVGRGLFELNRRESIGRSDAEQARPDDDVVGLPTSSRLSRWAGSPLVIAGEADVRDLLMDDLYRSIGELGSMRGRGSQASFTLKLEYGSWRCQAESPLDYEIPAGHLSHTSDILIRNGENTRFVSIELKYRSAVTDQFKCRSYDMLHMKQTFGARLLGVMVFAKSTTGISIQHAKRISYPFDVFVGVDASRLGEEEPWGDLVERLTDFLTE